MVIHLDLQILKVIIESHSFTQISVDCSAKSFVHENKPESATKVLSEPFAFISQFLVVHQQAEK